jgi:hypothetical protein
MTGAFVNSDGRPWSYREREAVAQVPGDHPAVDQRLARDVAFLASDPEISTIV